MIDIKELEVIEGELMEHAVKMLKQHGEVAPAVFLISPNMDEALVVFKKGWDSKAGKRNAYAEIARQAARIKAIAAIAINDCHFVVCESAAEADAIADGGSIHTHPGRKDAITLAVVLPDASLMKMLVQPYSKGADGVITLEEPQSLDLSRVGECGEQNLIPAWAAAAAYSN